MHDQVGDALAALLQPGQVLVGKYEVERVLGAGAMGLVISARHLDLDQPVAIKLMRPDVARSADSVTRFIREARAAARIQSEHVVRVHDVSRLDGGAPYIVMEHLTGTDLDEFLRARGPLRLAEAVEYVLQACEALAEAHMRGVVHRDLKPSNLFLTRRADGSPLVKVLDFGISKIKPDSGRPELSLTLKSDIFGTPFYMSPEQVQSAKDVDHRTDIWSLGVILHRLLTREYPFDADSLANCMMKILTEPPVPIRAQRSDVPVEVEAIILRCLEKQLSWRIPDVAVLARRLLPFAPAHCQASVDRIVRIVRGGEGIEDEITTMPGALEQAPPGAEDPGKTLVQQPIGMPPEIESSSPALSSSRPQLAADTPAPGGAASPRSRAASYATVAAVLTCCLALLLAAGIRALMTDSSTATPAPRGEVDLPASALPSTLEPAPLASGTATSAVIAAPAHDQPAENGTASPEVAPTVQIRLRVNVPGAQIEVDGTPVEPPLQLPRSDRVHQLRVSAPGHVPVTREVRADADGDLNIVLDPQAPTERSSRPTARNAGERAPRAAMPAGAQSPAGAPAAPAPAPSSPPPPPVGPLETSL